MFYLNPKMRLLLVENNIDNFTVGEFRDHLMSHFAEYSDIHESRKFIYRQLRRLVQNGLLAKNGERNSSNIRYSKATKFVELYQKVDEPQIHQQPTGSVVQSLKEKLNKYKVDIQTQMAESEEYMEILSEYPHLKKQLQKMSITATEQCSMLLGKTKAIENIISDLQQEVNVKCN